MTETIQKGLDEKYCSECGSIIKAKAEICPMCGVRQASPFSNLGAVAPNGKSKLAAALFAFFLVSDSISSIWEVSGWASFTCSYVGHSFRPYLVSLRGFCSL